ncbi:HNH endonuclease signature motif containing protein [Nocardiopsis lambiniae]|uniref:HNH endonuclease signature motif containing protein n=1 Tax=Nocardiopsis lambiniae TaxID=3075539 RepID=A0ABU2MCP6_9ACTN|nr:HNH endonuclease signature motif containing protein [Nocardiopsis sp. DSM 44743]MDT0330454.1 HNH endonuclease signature motif containing protein [Nocardiopsis sp. DSM 44743]
MVENREHVDEPAGYASVDVALRAAVEAVDRALGGPVPPGDEALVLDLITAVHRHMDAIEHRALIALARVQARGRLLEVGGQRTMAAWMTHAYGISSRRAAEMELLAQQLHHGRLPDTEQALERGEVSLGEAIAIAKEADKAAAHADHLEETLADGDTERISPEEARRTIEASVLAARENSDTLSVARIHRLGNRLRASLAPDRLEEDHTWAYAGRGARLTTTHDGAFRFEVWGAAADATLVRACLDSYTPPPPTGPDALVTPRTERTYEAFTTAMGVAHAHHDCAGVETPVVRLDVLVPDTVLAGDTTAGAAVTDTGRVLPVSVLREWLTRSTIRPLFVDGEGVVRYVGERRRLASSALRAAVFKNHSGCAWEQGCDLPLRWCQTDHIVEFFQGGPTRADNLQPLCSMHNRLKHRRALARDRHGYWAGRPHRGHRADTDRERRRTSSDTAGRFPAPPPEPPPTAPVP